MKNNLQTYLVIGLSALILIGLSTGIAKADQDSQERNKAYRDLLNTVDGLIRTIRLGNEVSENNLETLQEKFDNVFPNQGGAIRDEISGLNPSNLVGEDGANRVKEIREDIVDLAENSEDIGLSFIYDYAVFIIFGVSMGLAVLVNVINRTVVDWEEVNRVRNKQSELKDELDKAKKEGDTKKAHKLQKKQQKFMQQHAGTMFSPMKTMLIIFIPFIIVFQVLSSTYPGWVVAWLPFRLPWPDLNFFMLSRFFKGPAVSLGFFGWYLLSYFGFSQVWRKILVPSQ